MSSSTKTLSFPSHAVSLEEKESYEYGKKVGDAIENEWFSKENGTMRFFSNRNSYHNLRLYARGEQSVSKYKNELSINGDNSYLNVDWKPVPIIPKFVDIVVNGISERPWEIKCYSQDPSSIKKKTDYVEAMQNDMANRQIYSTLDKELGINMFQNDPMNLPLDNEDLSLHMQLDYKPSIEIAEEEAISNLFAVNKFDLIKRRMDYDVTVIGIAACKDSFNKSEGIVLEYLDPADIVYSDSKSPYYDDLYYAGVVKRISIPQLKKQYPQIEDEEIAQLETGRNGEAISFSSMDTDRDDESGFVYVLEFEYKTYYNEVHKIKKTKSGGLRAIRKDESFNPEGDNEFFEKTEKSIEMIFCGAKILGSDHLLEWKLAENMTRPKSDTTRANMSIHIAAPRMYNGRQESLVSRIIGFADMIQKIDIKLQNVINRMVPDGVFLDADGLNQIDLGEGKSYSPQEALNMYFQTGSVIGRSMTVDGEYNHGKIPVQELSSGNGGNKIQSLTAAYHHYLGLIREATGLNPARDAGTPDKDALVGVQKLAAANSNTATRHIVHAGAYLTLSIAESASLRISDVLEYSDTREAFINSLGLFNVATLDEISQLHKHDFGMFFELAPDEEEKQVLENNIQISLSQKEIDIEDAIDVRSVKNVKLGNQLLKKKRRERREINRRERMENMQAQTQSNIQSAEAAAAAAVQEEEAKAGIKANIMKLQKELNVQEQTELAEVKIRLMREEAAINYELKKIELGVISNKEKEKEDRKDKRTKIQASQQSELIEQRQKGTAPRDFESDGFDSLGDIGFEQFAPR